MLNKYPLIVNNTVSMKTTFNDFKILYYCDGFNNVDKIVEKTGLTRLEVLLTLKRFHKKGKLRIKYMIEQKRK